MPLQWLRTDLSLFIAPDKGVHQHSSQSPSASDLWSSDDNIHTCLNSVGCTHTCSASNTYLHWPSNSSFGTSLCLYALSTMIVSWLSACLIPLVATATCYARVAEVVLGIWTPCAAKNECMYDVCKTFVVCLQGYTHSPRGAACLQNLYKTLSRPNSVAAICCCRCQSVYQR